MVEEHHETCEPPFWRDPRILFRDFRLIYRPTCHHSPWNFMARIMILSLFVGLVASYVAGLPSVIVALLFGGITAFAILFSTERPTPSGHLKPSGHQKGATASAASAVTPSGTPIQDFHALPYVKGHAEAFVNGGAALGATQPVESMVAVDAHPYEGPTDFTPPTARNPFMNLLLDEQKYNPTRPAAASADHPLVKQTMDDFFRVQWFSDPTDVFGKNQSQRQFITMPSTTVPNDQGSFADWLYRIPGKTCKEGGRDACVGGTNGHIPWLGH